MTFDLYPNSILLPVLFVLLAVALSWFFYRRTNPPISRRLKRLLFALRAVALCLLVLLLFEPVLTFTSTVTKKPTVALLIDRSQSMSLIDSEGSRQKQLSDLLGSSILDSLSQHCQLKRFAFAEELDGLELVSSDSLNLAGQGTDIGSALEQLKAEFESEELSSVILFSDGANNLGKNPLLAAKAAGFPVFAVGIGSTRGEKDIRLSRLLVPPTAYAGDSLVVDVTLQSWGYAGVRSTVTLSEKGDRLAEQYATLSADGREQQLVFRLPVKEPGLHRYQVSIPPVEGERSLQNNLWEFDVKVLDSRKRVLLVAGRPSPDFSFLKRTLKGRKDVDVHPFVVKNSDQFYQGRLPVSEGELKRFDLIILLDVARSVLGSQMEQSILGFLQQGGGLLCIGGEDAFVRYAKTPLGDALPVIQGSGPSFRSGEFQLELSAQGERHPVSLLSGDPMESQRMWAELPPLPGINRLNGVRSEATVLAYCRDRDGSSIPLVVVGSYATGRVMVVLFSGFWRWELAMWGTGRMNRVPVEFWRNTLAWLTAPREISPVQVRTDKSIYRSGEYVNLQVQVYDALTHPESSATVIVTLSEQGNQRRQTQLKNHGGGIYQAQFSGLAPGSYQIEAIALKGQDKLGKGRGEFTVSEYSLEFQQTEADHVLLERIASLSGGRFFRAKEFTLLPGKMNLQEHKQVRRFSVRARTRLWVLTLLLGLLVAEWTVRRRGRLL